SNPGARKSCGSRVPERSAASPHGHAPGDGGDDFAALLESEPHVVDPRDVEAVLDGVPAPNLARARLVGRAVVSLLRASAIVPIPLDGRAVERLEVIVAPLQLDRER